MLRDYQKWAVAQLYNWFGENPEGNPCLVLPTGSGKSHIIAAVCKDALFNWPETRILMVTHQKELIEQNAAKLRAHWPSAPLGIYSAGVGQKNLGEPITFAGIQSLIRRLDDLGHVDLVFIDECHLVSHQDEGSYRTLLAHLRDVNPQLRVVGLTATPYRLGHGLITERPAIFDALIEPVSIEELVYKGFLAPLRSKVTRTRLDTTGVHRRGGEYIERELQAAVDRDEVNGPIVREVIELADGRKSLLFFCAGVDHAAHIRDELVRQGIEAECVTGATPRAERADILRRFRDGSLRAVTNANVLTTGFDHPGIDLIAMLRPTMSTSLYVQMAGRGMRPAPGKTDCLVLDFAGVVAMHGPITAVNPQRVREREGGEGITPAKACEACHELCSIACRKCPACGASFPEQQARVLELRDDDIMGLDDCITMKVEEWQWRKHVSRASGREMLSVSYYRSIFDNTCVTEYFPVLHEGYAQQKAVQEVASIAFRSKAPANVLDMVDLDQAARAMNAGKPPSSIDYKREGKFHRVVRRAW
ncbi:MAG: DEAD/DEAH box helicase [Steroidobacteraceae bacterium]